MLYIELYHACMFSIMLYIPVSKSELELETLSELMALLSDNETAVISQEYYHPGEGVQEWEMGQEDKIAAGMYIQYMVYFCRE